MQPATSEASNIARIMDRGFSLDENAQGTGLSLAIVKDISEIYGLKLEFASSSLGGLSVYVKFSTRDTKTNAYWAQSSSFGFTVCCDKAIIS